MRCPNCSRENQPTNQFCIFCGARLNTGVPPSAAGAETPAQPPQSIEEEVRQLRESVRQINLRLTALEQLTATNPIPAPPQVEHWAPPPSVPKPAPTPIPAPPPAEHWVRRLPFPGRRRRPNRSVRLASGNRYWAGTGWRGLAYWRCFLASASS